MNNGLNEIYANIPERCFTSIEDYCSSSSKHILTNPLLLAASDEYANAEKRVMIIGQETYHSPFWSFVDKCHESASLNGIGIITNNLSKVGFVGERGNDCEVSKIWGEILRLFEQFGMATQSDELDCFGIFVNPD